MFQKLRDAIPSDGDGKVLGLGVLDAALTQKMAYNGSDQLEYVGEAAPGALVSEEKWRIRKLTYSGTLLTDVQWASGESVFDKEWDERATYSYS